MFRCFNRFRLDNVAIRTCISNQFHIIAFSDERQTVILHARTAFNVAQYYYVRGLVILLVAQCFEHIAEKRRCQYEQRQNELYNKDYFKHFDVIRCRRSIYLVFIFVFNYFNVLFCFKVVKLLNNFKIIMLKEASKYLRK